MATKPVKTARTRKATRAELHRLVDELPTSELDPARHILHYLRVKRDPLLKKLLEAPFEDEPITPEEEAAVQEAWEDVKAGRVIPHEEVKRRFLGRP